MNFFLDMDGTLAEYAAKEIEDFYEPGYFEKLKPYESFVDFIKGLNNQGLEIFVVSACITDVAEKEKDAWLDEIFPEIDEKHRIFTKCGESKAETVKKLLGRELTLADILFDDYSPNCIDWEENGGKAIKVNNGINCSGKTWKGLTIKVYTEKE